MAMTEAMVQIVKRKKQGLGGGRLAGEAANANK